MFTGLPFCVPDFSYIFILAPVISYDRYLTVLRQTMRSLDEIDRIPEMSFAFLSQCLGPFLAHGKFVE